MDEIPEETPRRRRLRKLAEPPKRRHSPLLPLLIAAGLSLAILLVILVATIWEKSTLPPEERIAEFEQWQPEPDVQDPELDKARELYGQALELMARRRFDNAGPIIEEARRLHIKLLGRYDKHPRLAKLIEGQERQLCHQERLISERAAAEDLRPMALESQRRMREDNLKKARARAEELRQEGKYDDAIDLLKKFAEQHKDFDVAGNALEEARHLQIEKALQTEDAEE